MEIKKYFVLFAKNIFLQIISLFILLGVVFGAGTIISSLSQTVSEGDIITSTWYNLVNNMLSGPNTDGGICSYSNGKIMCNNFSTSTSGTGEELLDIGIGPEGSVLASTGDGYEWKFIGSLPRFQCSDEPAIDTKLHTGWSAVDIPSYCLDKRCMLKYEMYLNSTDALHSRRFTEFEQFTTDSNKWWSEYQTAGIYVNGDTSSVNIVNPFSRDYMVVRDDRSGTETAVDKLSVYDAHPSWYTKLFFCGDPSSELDTRDLVCNDYINTSTLTGWKSYDVPPECKSPSGCEFTVTLYTKKAATKTTPAYFTAGIPKQYNFKQRSDDNRWESTSNGTKLFQLVNGDKTSSDVIPPFSAYLYLRDDYKLAKTYEDYNSGSISVGDLHDSRYRDIKVCTYE